MRTTIELPDELMRKAKIRAATEGVSFKQFFIAAVEQHLAPKRKVRLEFPLIRTGGPPVRDLTPEEMEEAMIPTNDYLPDGH